MKYHCDCRICESYGEYNRDFSYKIKKIKNEIWETLKPLKNKLHDFGLDISFKEEHVYITFNYEKISETSFIKKHKIYECYLSISFIFPYFDPSICLLFTNELFMDYLPEKIDKWINIDYIFPVKSLLIHLFKFIGIDIFDRYLDYVPTDILIDIDTIIDNLKDHKNYEEYKNNLIKLNTHKINIDKNIKWMEETTISIENYKKEFNELIEEKENLLNKLDTIEKDETYLLKDIFETKSKVIKLLENIKDKDKKNIYDIYLKAINDNIKDDPRFSLENEINIEKKTKDFFKKQHIIIDEILEQNELLQEIIIIETIKFEKTLFPEIFNFEINKSEISENIDIYNKKYIYMINVIGKYLQNESSFEIIEQNIKHYLRFIYENFY